MDVTDAIINFSKFIILLGLPLLGYGLGYPTVTLIYQIGFFVLCFLFAFCICLIEPRVRKMAEKKVSIHSFNFL